MPDPLGQSGHAKDGRRGQVQGDCIRVRWQVRGTAPVHSHAGVEERIEVDELALH